MKVGIQIGLKAVLEHRAPKASTPILHTGGVESKVGRVPHVRDAPEWVVLTRLLGLNLVFPRPYGRGYSGATLLVEKALTRSIHLDGTAAKMAALQIYPKAQRVGRARSPLRAGAARTDPAYRLESGFPRPYGRGYAHLQCCSGGL